MWSTPNDREKAERQELEARIERVALQHPNEERTLTIQVKFNPREAVRYSEFIQSMLDAGHSVEDAIVGDIAALLESDNITDSNDVDDITDLVGIIKGLLRYTFEEVSSFNDLTLEEKEAVETPENFERLRQFAHEEDAS